MKGFARFFGKEIVEITRTWRLPVVAGVVFFFALTGPVLALLTPQLLESMQGSQPGVIIQVPDPTWRDAYAQWAKNLAQIVAFVAIIVSAGSVAGEVSSKTTSIVLTKPVSRASFIVAKALALFALFVVAVGSGTAVTQLVTYATFGEAPSQVLWTAAAAWLVFAALLVAIAVLLSAVLPTLAAAGISIGVFFAISLAGLWRDAVLYSPAGLLPAPAALLAGEAPDLGWPIATTVAASVLVVATAAAAFTRREL